MKKQWIIACLIILALMEGVAWLTWQRVQKSVDSQPKGDTAPSTEEPLVGPKASPAPVTEVSQSVQPPREKGNEGVDFPSPTTAVVDGRTERTIHMGVRQYVWEPATITAVEGELVRLIIHNADVLHGLVIPDLGVMEGDIPPDGAVIEFMASKTGTFEFFCSVWCGEGHMEMRGQIIIRSK